MAWKGSNNLKPLQHPSPTGFFRYSGEPLSQEDLANLRADDVRIPEKPFDWNPATKKSAGYDSKQWDIMPDNRLKFAKFRKKKVDAHHAALERGDGLDKERIAERRAQYMALPDPKPDFCEWAAQQSRIAHFESLERVAMRSRRDGDRIKAIATIFEFTKTKPKTVVETTSTTPDEQIDLDKALNILLEAKLAAKGIELEKFEKWIQTETVDVKTEA